MADTDVNFFVGKRKWEGKRSFVIPGDKLLLVYIVSSVNNHVCKAANRSKEEFNFAYKHFLCIISFGKKSRKGFCKIYIAERIGQIYTVLLVIDVILNHHFNWFSREGYLEI